MNKKSILKFFSFSASLSVNFLIYISIAFSYYYLYFSKLSNQSAVVIMHSADYAGVKSSGAFLAMIIVPVFFLFKRKWREEPKEIALWCTNKFWVVSIVLQILFSINTK